MILKDGEHRGGSRIFSGGGAFVSCSTSTPINHRIPVVLENRRSPQGGGGGGAHHLHPPPRSAPGTDFRIRDL